MNLEEAIKTIKNLKSLRWFSYAGDRGKKILSDEEDEAIDTVLRTIKIKDEYLKLLNDMLIDYDGWHTAESLKELIDETRDYIHKALKNDDKSVITVNSKKKFNILGEEVE